MLGVRLARIGLKIETAILGITGRLARSCPLMHFLPFVLTSRSLRWVRLVFVTIIHVMTPFPLVTGGCSSAVSFVRIASCADVLNPAILSPVGFLENVQLLLI